MAHVYADRVKETSTTTGTGTLTLAGAATGYQSFAAIGDGNTCDYAIELVGSGEWEVGTGTYTASGTTLARTTVRASSNAGSAVNFSAGTKLVYVAPLAHVADVTVRTDTTDNFTVGYTTDLNAIGNSGTGTVTVSLTAEALQTLTINGSFTLAPPSSGNGIAVILATTDGTGGYTLTSSGFTVVNGTWDNTASKVHRFVVTKIDSTTILDIDEVA
jgi:hypothetical protein